MVYNFKLSILTGKNWFSGTGTSRGISVVMKSLLSIKSRLPSSIPYRKHKQNSIHDNAGKRLSNGITHNTAE